MKNSFFKRVTASVIALLMVGASIPAGSSFAELIDLASVSASAEETHDSSYIDIDAGTLYIAGNNLSSELHQFLTEESNSVTKIVALPSAKIPETCSGLLSSFPNVETIDLSAADFSQAKDLTAFFGSINSLRSVKLSGVNMPVVEDMTAMFNNCSKLISVDLTGIQMGNTLKSTSSMFMGCEKLATLDLKGLKTSNVTNMSAMFCNCGSLRTIDLTGFDASNVTNMSAMFYGCCSLESLDLSSFNAKEVKLMNSTFCKCQELRTIQFSDSQNNKYIDTSKVTDMNDLFSQCSKLQDLDLSSFDTSCVTDMSGMFSSDFALETLDVSSFDTSAVTNMESMFHSCRKIKQLDLSSFDTSKVTNMNFMFNNCSALNTIAASDRWSTNSIDTAESYGMFSDCTALVGGMGTKYNESNIGVGYARIDGGVSAPGYLTSVNNSYVAGTSLTLTGDIGVNVYIKPSAALISNGYAVITGPNGLDEKHYFKDLTPDNNGYRLTASAYSTQMSENVTVKLYSADDVLQPLYDETKTVCSDNEYVTSVERYINAAKTSSDTTLANIAKALNDYGACAQKYFGAPQTMTADKNNYSGINGDPNDRIDAIGLSEIEYIGKSLILRDRTSIRIYFKPVGDMPKITLGSGDDAKTLTPVKKGDAYYVEIPGVSAADLDKQFTVNFGKDIVNASARSYMSSVIIDFIDNAAKADLVELCQSLYKYSMAAEEYFA